MNLTLIIVLVVIAFIVFSCFVTVKQGTVAVVTQFGQYKRVMRPGLNFKLPVLEKVERRVSRFRTVR